MQMGKRMAGVMIVAGVLMGSVSACSYREFEDNVKDSVQKEIAGAGQDGDTLEGEVESATEGESQVSDSDRVVGFGDTMVWVSPYKQTVEYAVEKVEIADSIGELGLKKEDFYVQDLIQDENSFVPCMDTGSEKYQILLLTVAVNNVDFQGYDKNQEIPQLYAEHSLVTEAFLNRSSGKVFEAEYFSHHAQENVEKDYYKYNLEKGAEVQIQIGWILPESMLKEPLYYVIDGTGTGRENYHYLCLQEK